MALSGALIGIAVMFKQVAIVNWFLLGALYPIFAHEEKRWRGAASFVVWSATGLLSVLGLAALYFWRRGGLNEFVDNVFTHNLEYIGAVGTSARVEYCWGTLSVLARTQAIVWAFAAAGLTGLLTSGRAKWSLFLAGWLLTSFVGVSASGYFFRTISSSYFRRWRWLLRPERNRLLLPNFGKFCLSGAGVQRSLWCSLFCLS
jgi:hypothetical protein